MMSHHSWVIRLSPANARRPEENAFNASRDGRTGSAGACLETGGFGADSSRSEMIVQVLLGG
jgi:hypothetical protein